MDRPAHRNLKLMTLTSYAQNFEDVMLWRALGHVTPGFYIDIGAQDPVIDSVSLAFYEHGWRGVHVEPTRRYSEKIGKARPDETVKQVAIGDTTGLLTFYEFPETGLSTAGADIAQRHVAAGHAIEKTEVQVITLASLLDEFSDKPIHWLKIDVEGMEASVLRGWKGSSVRPWVLILESTKPSSKEENYDEWEHLVVEKHYAFAYFDGLNRFYVHEAHADLMPAFRSPPNVFDDFFLSGTSSHPFSKLILRLAGEARACAHDALTRASAAESTAAESEARYAQATEKAKLAEAEVQLRDEHLAHLSGLVEHVYASASWQITRPLRWLKKALRAPQQELAVASRRIGMALRQIFKSFGRKLIRRVLSYPKLRRLAINITSRFPVLDARLRVLATRAMQQPAPLAAQSLANFAEMPEDARRIFNELKRAVDRAGH
jgi:FkbM family methyltransferase